MALPAFSAWDRTEITLRWMAFSALLEHDLKTMTRSWVVRIWALLTIALALITIPAGLNEGPISEALAGLLGAYPIVWSTVAILTSAGAVSSEAGVVADSILSKAVTRYDYILAKFAGRLITVLGVYLLVVVPASYLFLRADISDLTRDGVLWGIALVGATLMLITSLAVTFSTIFNRSMVAIVVTWILWYVMGFIFALLEIEEFSPVHVVEEMPLTLQGDFHAPDLRRTLLLFSGTTSAVIALAVAHFARKDL